MSYVRFGLMILTSTVVMFIMMYLNTYALEHVFFSETRTYMAILMGATMAVIMLAYMLGMYANKALNIAIFAGAIVVFALSLWLVRSQVTVSGPSYMQAMIPHHSIAIMTSERAQIRDPRVRKMADEIIEAQRREIAEMRYLIAEVSDGNTVDSVYQDPPAEVGTIEDALGQALVSTLDPSPMPKAEADEILAAGSRCVFHRSPRDRPHLLGRAGRRRRSHETERRPRAAGSAGPDGDRRRLRGAGRVRRRPSPGGRGRLAIRCRVGLHARSGADGRLSRLLWM